MSDNYIEINGEHIGIGGKVDVERNSPFFDREEKVLTDGRRINPQGDFATTATVISNGRLQSVLGHIDKMTFRGQPREISGAKLFSRGRLIDKGTVFIDEIEKDLNSHASKYSLNFIMGELVNYLDLVGDKTLKELTLNGIINIPGGVESWPDATVPFQKPGDETLLFVVAGASGSVPPVIQYGDPFANWTDTATSVEMKTAVYANDIAENGHDYFCFPSMIAYQDDRNEDGSRKFIAINRWDGYSFVTYKAVTQSDVFDDLWTRFTPTGNALVPMFYYHQVLKHCFTEFGYTLNDDWLLQDESYKKLFLPNTYNIVRGVLVTIENLYNRDITDDVLYYEKETEINPANHLPDMTITEFLKDVMLRFNIFFDVKDKVVTIIHNELETVQREIKVVGDKIKIRPEKKVGLKLAYPLDNAAYDIENKVAEKYTKLADDTEEPSLANGDKYFDRYTNFVYEKASGDDVLKFNNLIPYNSGDAKSYTIPLSPVNMKWMNWYEWQQDNAIHSDEPFHFLPFIVGAIGGVEMEYYTYGFLSDGGGPVADYPVPGGWVEQHTYELLEVTKQTDFEGRPISNNGEDLKMIAFYHGFQLTGKGDDIIANNYPYASYHNYIPMPTVNTKVGDWHLGLHGTEGIIETYWRLWVNIFNNNRRFILSADEDLETLKAHKWNQSVLCRGALLYIAVDRFQLAIDKFPIYEALEI